MTEYSGFVYLWINKENGMKYVGSHIGKEEDGYIGSGIKFLNAYNKYGSVLFERKILEFVIDEKDVRKREQYYLDLWEVASNKEFYNISQAAKGGKTWDNKDLNKKLEIGNMISKSRKGQTWEIILGKEEADKRKQEMSERFLGVPKTEEFKQIVSVIHTGKKVTKETRKKQSDSAKDRKIQPLKGRHFYNNGKVERYFKEDDNIPVDFTRGRLPEKFKNLIKNGSKGSTGLSWFNDGKINKMFKKDTAPVGWIKGKLISTKEKTKGKNNGFYGRTHSTETRMKQSEQRKGKGTGADNPSAKSVCIDNIIYATKREAMKSLNLSYNRIQKKLKEKGNYEISKKDNNKTR